MNILKLIPAILFGMAAFGGTEEGKAVPKPERPRGSDEDGHRYYPPRKSHAAPGKGREHRHLTAAQAEFPRHQTAGLTKSERNAAKRERRARRVS